MTTIRKPLFIVPLALGTFVASATTTGFPVSNLGRTKAVGLTWKAPSTGGLWVRGNWSASQAINFMAMANANALPGTTIRLRLGTTQAQVDGTAPYDSGVLSFISPSITAPSGLYHSHLELSSTVNATWWRIDIAGHTGDFQAAHLVLGQSFQPSRFYNLDFQYGVKDLGTAEFTRFGVFDEEEGKIFRTVEFTLGWQTEAEFETNFRPMIEKLGRRGIAYVVFDPEPTIYRQARTYMGIMDKPPFAKGIRKPRTFSQDFSIVSMI